MRAWPMALACLAGLLLLSGCSSAPPSFVWPWWHRTPPPIPRESWPADANVAVEPAVPASLRAGSALIQAQPAAEVTVGAAATRPLSASGAAPADAETMAQVLRELQSLGGLTADQQERLLATLKGSESSTWPQLVREFRAAMPPPQPIGAVAAAAGSSPPQAVLTGVIGPPAEQAAPVQTLAGPGSHPSAPALLAAHQPQSDTGQVIQATATATLPTVPQATAEAAAATSSPATEPPAVLPAATIKQAVPGDWNFHLAAAIGALEAHAAASPDAQAAADDYARLRLLYLAAGRRDDALRTLSGLEAAQQEFWSQELSGLATYLDTASGVEQSGQAAAAAAYFEGAQRSLRSQAAMVVRNLAFCTEVTSYGVYQTFPTTQFAPGQEVLLYAEVENLKSQQRPDGYFTALDSGYEIVDAQGKSVETRQFGLTQEVCRNERRDFFIRYQFFLPKELPDGVYTLNLKIQDTLGQKVGQASIELTMKK